MQEGKQPGAAVGGLSIYACAADNAAGAFIAGWEHCAASWESCVERSASLVAQLSATLGHLLAVSAAGRQELAIAKK